MGGEIKLDTENKPSHANQPMHIPVNHMNKNKVELKKSIDPNQVYDLIDLFRENPNLYKEFDEKIKKDNNNYNEHDIFHNRNYMRMARDGKTPRRVFSQIDKKNENIPIKVNNDSNLINICFLISTGQKFNEQAINTLKTKDLFIKFITRLGFTKELLDKNIAFLFNGIKIDHNEEKTLREMGIGDNSIIVTMDLKGIIGA